ncbi:MAG TPA: type II secretion system protein [Candidatus Paceibacterota bacterium]|nr:type II secretion system protein [Candidatus Paceibacterota bacterium]
MSNKKETGFTLIELLVVIAVIGILAGVILASLGTSKDKSADAVIKQELHQLQTQAALYYDTNKNYGVNAVAPGACFTPTGSPPFTVFADPVIEQIARTAGLASGGLDSGRITRTACGTPADEQSYAAAVTLKTSSTSAWCVDSSGNAKLETVANGNNPADAMNVVGTTEQCK